MISYFHPTTVVYFPLLAWVLPRTAISTVTDSALLSCDFDRDFCEWKNDKQASSGVEWRRDVRVAYDVFHSIPRGVNGPSKNFGDFCN